MSETAKSEEIKLEQERFDHAYELREELRSWLRNPPDAAANPKAARALLEMRKKRLEDLRPPDEAVAFGRLDDGDGHPLFVGYDLVPEDDEAVVASWTSDVGRRYAQATYKDPRGLVAKRSYTTERNNITDFSDVIFAALERSVQELTAATGEAVMLTDTLLADLKRHRTGEMQDIARTIEAAQYDIIAANPDQLLVVQGGPGTGKTSVALLRVSWLIANEDALRPEGILVLGPGQTFVRYIAKVLPGLGNDGVMQTDLPGLLENRVSVGREDEFAAQQIKGQLRMTGIVDRGLRDRIRTPKDHVEVETTDRPAQLTEPTDLAERIARLAGLRYYAAGRQQLREFIRDRLNRTARAVNPEAQLETILEKIWPQLTGHAFLRELYGSRQRLQRAGGDAFTAADLEHVYRPQAERLSEEIWTRADVAILDYADYAINGPTPQRFDHIIVDEAQDLSPMDLAMLARRSTNSAFTIFGDLAQSTGPWARDSWTEVLEVLGDGQLGSIESLRFGYRVPRQIYEFASTLLPYIAPDVEPPLVVQDGPAEPLLLLTDDRVIADEVVSQAKELASNGCSVGVICPKSRRSQVEGALNDRGVKWMDAREGLSASIVMIDPTEARGLEFDAVVVVDPEAIADQSAHGHRLLYIALTRSTQYLTVVHTGTALPLPVAPASSGTGEERAAPAVTTESAGATDEAVDTQYPSGRLVGAIAEQIANDIRGSVQPDAWEELMEAVRLRLIEKHDE